MAASPWRIKFKVEVSGEIEIYPPETTDGGATGGTITFTTDKETHMGEIVVDAGETTLKATVTFSDAEGNATVPDVTPTWECADESVVTCTVAEDGMSASFEVGSPGVSAVTVWTVETHGGEGDATEILLTGLVTVTAGDTVTGSIDFTVG